MAKKTKGPKKGAKKGPRRAKPSARDRKLPEMDDPRFKDLDDHAQAIAADMETINAATERLKSRRIAALASMHVRDVTTYKAYGVELVRVPGDEKLRARLIDNDEGGDAEDGGTDEERMES